MTKELIENSEFGIRNSESFHLSFRTPNSALRTLIISNLTLWIVLTGFIGIWAMQDSAAADGTNSCIECHRQLEGELSAPTQEIAHDVHIQRGLSCVDCHGGDPASDDPSSAMDPAKGFVGRPARGDIPQFCARCHADPSYMRRYNPNIPTDQYLKYQSSQHGKRNIAGDQDVAVCTSCHGVHGIRSKKDPASSVYSTNIPASCAHCHADASLMSRHGLPADQYRDYSKSVHGQALLVRGDRAAPHCASCHGSHEAAKPGTIAVGNVCAQCHSLTRDLFAKSPHKAAHDALGLPECEVCHGNHLIQKPTDSLLGTDNGALCIRCHKSDSVGYATAQKMRYAIERVKSIQASAEAVVKEASQLGMDMTDADYELRETASKLTQARTYVHSFSFPAMESITEEGIQHATLAKSQGEGAIREFYFRRKGLWVTLGIMILLVSALILKIRDIGLRSRATKDDSSRRQ